MSKNLKQNNQTDELFEGILALKSVDECYNFFDDLCTVAEVSALAQRFAIAKMLDCGMTYAEIEQCTGASSATIGRINKCLLRGENGYKAVISRLTNN